MNAPTDDQIRAYVTDPLTFMDDLIIPAMKGSTRFGDVMAPEQRDRFAALAPSLMALAHGVTPPIGRFWVECVKGWSKTSDLAACILWLAAFSSRPIGSAQIAASDQDQASEGRKAALDLLHLNPWLSERVKVHNWKILCDATGFEATIVAADEAGSHGGRPLLLWIDEVHAITKSDFISNLLDNADKVEGVVICSTNAGFQGSDCWRLREIARNSPRWRFLQLTTPPPWIGQAKLEEAKLRNSTSRYLRLWWGVWSSGTGDALDPADIDLAVLPALEPIPGRSPGFAFAAGLDLGVKNDRSALVVLAKRAQSQNLQLARCLSWSPERATGQVDLEAVEAAVLKAHRDYGLESVRYDPSQCYFMAQRLSKRGVRMVETTFNGSNLNTMATWLLETFRSRLISLYDCPQLVADLKRLFIVEKSYGYKLEAVSDSAGHADTAISLVLAGIGTKSLSYSAGSGNWRTIKTAGLHPGQFAATGGKRRFQLRRTYF